MDVGRCRLRRRLELSLKMKQLTHISSPLGVIFGDAWCVCVYPPRVAYGLGLQAFEGPTHTLSSCLSA